MRKIASRKPPAFAHAAAHGLDLPAALVGILLVDPDQFGRRTGPPPRRRCRPGFPTRCCASPSAPAGSSPAGPRAPAPRAGRRSSGSSDAASSFRSASAAGSLSAVVSAPPPAPGRSFRTRRMFSDQLSRGFWCSRVTSAARRGIGIETTAPPSAHRVHRGGAGREEWEEGCPCGCVAGWPEAICELRALPSAASVRDQTKPPGRLG